jgi:hypothetical protein
MMAERGINLGRSFDCAPLGQQGVAGSTETRSVRRFAEGKQALNRQPIEQDKSPACGKEPLAHGRFG